MSTPLTADQATALLRENPDSYITPTQLRALAAQVDADAPGKLTVLYSGSVAKGVWSSDVINAMVESGEDVRVIDKSQAADFLKSREFYQAVAKAYDIPARPLMNGSYRGPASDWLYHPTEGPWADASARFADATKGEVRAIVSGAAPDRVFGATEVPHILANPNVPAVEGIPHKDLLTARTTYGEQAPFEMIVARSHENVGKLNVAVNYAGEPLRDGRDLLELDSRAYFAGTSIEGKAPSFTTVTRPLADAMGPPGPRVEAGLVHLNALSAQTTETAESIARGGLSPNLVRGAGVLGAAAMAYDATTTAAHTSDLLHQGNTIGAQSQVEHFVGRTGGGWAGFAAGAEVAGAAGIESGPADLVVAGVGGIVGAVAADKIADWRDQQRIYTQTDPQGTTWHLDPKQPQQGWTRSVQTDQLDTDAMRFSEGMPVYKTRTESAPPAMAERLTFQANSAAVDLALANPPTPRDPFTQPAGPKDTPSRVDAPWRHDAQTQQWSRTVTDEVLEHGIKSTHVETASLQRAAELDAAAQHTMAENLAQSPRGIAEHYRTAYEQNGWAKYGPVQPSVTNALKAPENTLQASDGKTYTHQANGQWTTPGHLWGTNMAEGNVRAELNATAQTAAAHRQPSAQAVPQATVKTAPEAPPPIPEHLRDFRHPDHPMHGNYQNMLGHVHAMENANRIPHGPHSERTAAALADQQSADRLGWVKQVELHDQGQRTDIHLVTGEPAQSSAKSERVTPIRSDDAIARPVEQVSQDWSRRELPHIYQHQALDSEPRVRDAGALQADDPRRTDHPRHEQFEALRERVGAAYAQYGVMRSEGQLDRATAAVMLDLQKSDPRWQMPDRVHLTADPQTGKVGPGSGVMTDNSQSFLPNMTFTQAAVLQQTPEASFQQMNQVGQQQAQMQAVQAQTQAQGQAAQQQQGPAL
jgi:hypothetical protein